MSPMYLQKNERMEALSYVILMALIVYIVLQRRVRQSLEKETEPLEITGGKKSFTPTGNKLLELFSPVKILCICVLRKAILLHSATYRRVITI